MKWLLILTVYSIIFGKIVAIESRIEENKFEMVLEATKKMVDENELGLKRISRLYGALFPVILWCSFVCVRDICPQCIETLEQQVGYPAVIVMCVSLMTFYAGYLLSQSNKKDTSVIVKELSQHITTNPAELKIGLDSISKFEALLSSHNIKELPNKYYLYLLLTNPYRFVFKRKKFIKSIFTTDKDNVHNRVRMLKLFLDKQEPLCGLPHYHKFLNFRKILGNSACSSLPHPEIIDLAHYVPSLLNNFPSFLIEVAKIIHNDKPLVCLYYNILVLDKPMKERYDFHLPSIE